jgi:hypothetical protein
MGDEVLCGLGALEKKSTELSLVSKQPPFNLIAAVVFESSGAVPEPSKQSVGP